MSTQRDEWTKAVAGMDKRPKYGSRKKMVDGYFFDSVKEAEHYVTLRVRERAGEITDLEMQPQFPLYVPVKGRIGEYEQVAIYRADFRYREGPQGLLRVEDVKSAGTRTPIYRLKRKMVEAIYDIRIIEV